MYTGPPTDNFLKKALTWRPCCEQNLPLKERIQFYNAIIKPVLMFGGLIWSSAGKENLRRVSKLQKRTVTLFNKLKRLPFDDELKGVCY